MSLLKPETHVVRKFNGDIKAVNIVKVTVLPLLSTCMKITTVTTVSLIIKPGNLSLAFPYTKATINCFIWRLF